MTDRSQIGMKNHWQRHSFISAYLLSFTQVKHYCGLQVKMKGTKWRYRKRNFDCFSISRHELFECKLLLTDNVWWTKTAKHSSLWLRLFLSQSEMVFLNPSTNCKQHAMIYISVMLKPNLYSHVSYMRLMLSLANVDTCLGISRDGFRFTLPLSGISTPHCSHLLGIY